LVGDDRFVCPEAQTGQLQEMMKPLPLLPTNGAVLAGQYRGPSDRSFEASGRDGQVMDASEMRHALRRGCRATRRSCLSQRAKREPLRHCTTLDAADPARAQNCAQRPEPSTAVAPSAGSAWRSLLRRATVTFPRAFFVERAFLPASSVWRSVDERTLNEKRSRCRSHGSV
jgi:hypothetical protein